MDETSKQPVRSFRDLEVYQNTYKACIVVAESLLPKLPSNEKFDLTDQLSRSSKAIPRLIAEGYAKKHQRAGFQKYIDDAMAECNETVVSLEQVRDIYKIEIELCTQLVDIYDKSGRQLYKLGLAWDGFKNRGRKPLDDSGGVIE